MTQPGTSSDSSSIARRSLTCTVIESATVPPLERRAPRNTYDAAGALPGTETPTSHVSVAPGATANGVFPITIAQPRGTVSTG